MMNYELGLSLLLGVLCLVIRLRPFRHNPRLGIDHWYWLLCAEDVKKRRKLPPRLPYFMLEIEEQWYPPLFAGLLALLPLGFLEKHGGKISQLLDLLQGLFIFLVILLMSGNTMVALLSGLSYAIAFFPMTYNLQLQPRVLANLLLTLTMGGLWVYIDAGSLIAWICVLILSVIVLFLHKMTAQMWAIYLLGFGISGWSSGILLLIPASLLIALIVSKGFYIKMLKAHWDIVSFWTENIDLLGSHQYYESPLYGSDTKSGDRPSKNLKRLFSRLMLIPYYNVFALVLLPILVYDALHSTQGELQGFLWTWLILTYAWAFSTAALPYFRALGAGALYVYQSFTPVFLLSALSMRTMSPDLQQWILGSWVLGMIVSIIQWRHYSRSLSKNKTDVVGDDLKGVLDYLKELPKNGVFCIPFRLPDVTAYWTRKKVFWGGHSYGFHTHLKPYFPVMRQEVRETLKKNALNYLLFWRGYLRTLKDIGLEEGRDIKFLFGKGQYELYEVIK